MTAGARTGDQPSMAKAPAERVLRMVGNAHIDPVWLWQWPEGLAEVRATFRSALDRMDEYPDFIFTAGSAAYYDWIERTDAPMFEEIRARVDEGRWELAGGWWVDPDCNLPGGESFVRQALLGQRYFESRFGRTATVGFNVDSFGHAATLPALLLGAGLSHYVFMRPQPHELDLPGEVFWWEAPDGSRILAARLLHEYCGPPGALEAYVEAALAKMPAGARESMLFYGVGNHGGGPTRANIDSLHALDRGPGDTRLVLSSPERYFAGLRQALASGEVELPVWRGELQHHARGCYSAHSGVKRWDRAAERALLTAEALRAVASPLLGEVESGRAPDDTGSALGPADGLGQAWRNVAFNQFHDILGGTAIEPAYEDARSSYGEAMAIAERATVEAFQRIARRIHIPADPATKPIVVFNAHPWAVTEVVEIEVAGVRDDDVLVDEAGGVVAHQRIQSLATWTHWRRRLAFRADLPPLGYRTYRLVQRDAAAAAVPAQVEPAQVEPAPSPLRVSATVVENEHLRVGISAETGWIDRLVDLSTGIDIAGEGLLRAVVYDDPSDTWSHAVVGYDGPVGAFVPERVRLVEAGPVRATIRVDGRFEASRLTLDVSLAAGAREVEVRALLDWRERRRLLKLRFGTVLDASSAVVTAGIAFGAVRRPTTGSEEPGGPWMDVSGTLPDGRRAGVIVANDSKSALDARGGDLGLTIVRSPIFAHHDPRVADEEAEDFAYQDQGAQRFRLLLRPHPGDLAAAAPARLAAGIAQPPLALLESFHEGPLPQRRSFGAVEGEGTPLATVKRAEDAAATIVRLIETTGRSTNASVRLAGGRGFDVELPPWRVRTFTVPDDASEPVVETDLLERPLAMTRPAGMPAEPASVVAPSS